MNLHQVAQLGLIGVVNGSSYALLGVSFALIISVTGRFHLAYITTYTGAAYCAVLMQQNSHIQMPFWGALIIALVFSALLGMAIEGGIYRTIAKRTAGASLLTIFVASLGLTIATENGIRLINPSPSQTLTGISHHGRSLRGVTFTDLDIVIIGVSLVLVFALAALLRYTRAGRQIDAVRVNPEMARVVGIDPERIYLLVFAIGSILGGVAAILFTLKFAASPNMGLNPVFQAFLVAFLAGTASSPQKLTVVALLIGLAESWSGLWFKTQWSPLVVFGILFVYLCLLPLDFWRRPRRLVQAFAR